MRVYFQNVMSPVRLREGAVCQMCFEKPMPPARAGGIARWGQ